MEALWVHAQSNLPITVLLIKIVGTNVPKIAPSSIRRYRFTTPYPIPHAAVPPISGRGYMQSLPQKLLQDREELRKPKPPIEVKPDIKNVKDEDQKGDVKSEDVKPAIQNEEAKVFKAEQVEQKPVKVEQGLVKPEPHDGSMKAEPEGMSQERIFHLD